MQLLVLTLLLYMSLISGFRSKSHRFGLGLQGSLCMSSTSPPAPPSAWILTYQYVEGILEKRAPYREAHLKLSNDLVKEGKMLCAGPYADASGAMFIFTKSQTDAIEFVEKDDYVKNDLVPSYEIKQWTVGVNGNILD